MKMENLLEVIVVAGKIGDVVAPDPAPDSWAADPANEVAMWRIKMEAGAQWTLPAASPEVRRTLYFYKGSEIFIAGIEVDQYKAVQLHADQEVIIENGSEDAYLLLLQGLPINEPVAQYGPFVMNNNDEIQQAIRDYRSTQFGGWPWPRHDNVHDRKRGRFAKHADGREEVK
jgi:quercetin 2,3-dioxygenase